VTVFVCSAENLQRCGDAEIAFLMQVIEDVVAARLARPQGTWQVH
jgi:short-chain Z-isoprenyl diphosphate synthase